MNEQTLKEDLVSQGSKNFRSNMPEWIKQLPRFRFKVDNPNFQLIDPLQLEEILKSADPEAVLRIKEDMEYLDKDLLRLFRELDFEAKLQQNRYRLYQLGYILMATAATLVGSILAIALQSRRDLVPFLGFLETLIALATTFLATISGREQPLPLYLSNRQRAEHLRREYFRYLMDLPPYVTLDGYERRRTLAVRAAKMYSGNFHEI